MNVFPLALAVVRSHDLVGGANKGDLLLHETVQRTPTIQSFNMTLSSMCASKQIIEFCIVQLQRDKDHHHFSVLTSVQRILLFIGGES